MAYESHPRRAHRSAIRRVRLHCILLMLPTLAFAAVFFYQGQVSGVAAVLLVLAILVYFALAASAMIDGLVRPLQTLSNVVESLREGDYSFRARRAGDRDALGELAGEVNALADLLQKQRVHSLEATALLARILEVMHTPLFAFDRDDRLQLVNEAGLDLLRLPSARSVGRSASELGLGDLLNSADQSTLSLAADRTRWLLRKAVFRQEGVPHTLLLLTNVSLALQNEERTAWKRLIRVLGHELSNSLAPIKSIAGSLAARIDTFDCDQTAREDFRRGLGVVEGRADALHRFLESYRRLAQLPPPQIRPVSAGALLERVALLEQRLPVELEVGPQATLHADPDQLEQMLINLLSNAVDASLANGSHPVKATWRVAGASLQFIIEDSGLGIANTDNLFVPFYTTKQQGSGVGLVLAQQIARAHGGEIQLENRDDGQGARATVRLPIAEAIGLP